MNVFTSFCVMLAWFLPVYAISLTGCPTGNIVNGDQTSFTCIDILRDHNITWSITGPSTNGTEITIGTCWFNYSCQHFNDFDTDYNITRSPVNHGSDESIVSFVANETAHHNTTIKCARFGDPPGVTCGINVNEVYRLSGCFVVENAQTKISCSYREPSYGMYWSVEYPDGSYSTVAECAPCVNNTCPDCDVNNTDFRVTRDGQSSVIQMVNGRDVDKDGAKLKCSRNDNDTADMCTIKVFYYKLPQCEDRQVDVSEVEPWTTVTCDGLRQLQNMNWTITDLTGNISQIAFCASKRNCTTDNGDAIVTRKNQYSDLTFVGDVREQANLTLTCIKRDGGSQASCRIRTFYPAETNNVTVGVDSNFTVTGRVFIDKVYASDNNITCQWYHTLDNKTGDQLLSSLSLSTFTDMDGLEYRRGHCDMTLSVNSSEITHFFGVLILPSNDTVQFAGAVTIEKPGQTLTTTCPDYVSEGSDLTCACSHLTAQHGNPPATISWRDVTDTPGLHIRNVSKDMNGSEFVCTSVWGEGRSEEVYFSHNYTMLVAYGPNMVTVSASGDGNDDLHNVTLTCTYDAAYPSVNFTWSVACVTLTPDSSTCTIDMGMIDVRDVICTAVNTKFPEINANDLYTFVSNDAVTSPPFPLVGVVVGVVAAVLLCIIIIVVVIIVKRRGSRKTHKDSSTRANDDRDVDEEKGSHLSNSKDQVTPSGFEEHINADNVDAVTSLQVLTVRDDQLQGSSKDATKQGQSTEMAHFNKDAKEATIKEKEAKLKMLEIEKQTARENEERNREEKKKEKAREQEEQKRQKAEEKEAKKKQEAQAKEDKKREKEEKMAEKVREEEEKKKEKEREEDAKKKAKAEEEEKEDAKKKEKEREEEEKKKEKAKEEEAKREKKAREEEAHRKEKARKEEEEKEKNEAKKKEKEREEEEKREKEKAEEEKRKEEENRKAKAKEDEERKNKAREEEAKNRQRAAEKDAKQKQEALEKEERKAKTIEDEKRTDNNIAMETPETKATNEEKEGKPHMVTTKPEEKEKKRTETPEEREARKQRKLKRLLEKILQKIMQVFMDRHGYTDTDTDAKMLEKTREREARKRQKAEEREARRKERLANKKETIEAQEEKEARREARKQQKIQEKEARRKERLARKEEEKMETEEEKEARRQARRLKKEARKAREQEKKAREETRKARKQDEKAREHDKKPKDPAVKKDQNQDLTNTAKGVLQAGLGGDVGTEKTARPADTDEFEEHINELYESADTLDDKTKNASPRHKVVSEHDDFEEHINDLYESADDLDRPENSSKTKFTKSKSGAPGLAPDDEFEEHINDFYESADNLDVPEKSSKMNSPKSTRASPDDDFEEHINDLYESADDLDSLGNPTKSRQSQGKVEQLADGKYAVDGSIYHELESEEDTSETVTDTDYESIGYDSDIYDSIGELDTTDDSSSDSYADSLDEEIYDYIDDIYESIDDVFDVKSSDTTPDTKTGAKDGPNLPLFLKEKLASPGTDALLSELKAVLKRAQKEGVAIPRKEPRPKEKVPLSQAEKEDMKSPCTNGGIQGTAAPSLKGVPNRLDLSGDGCISVKAAKAFLDSQVHMYSQDEWAKKKGKPQEKEWNTEKDPAEKPLKETATGTDKPQDKESSTTEKTEKQAMKVPQSIRQKEDTTKGSVMKKTPPTVPQKPKGGNWKLNGQAQPDAPEELVYTDCLSQSKKADALTALVGKPTSSPADKEVIIQEPNAQIKPRRSELYVSVAPLKQKPKVMTKSANTGDDNRNGRAAGSKTQEVTKTAEPDDVYNELASTRRRNQEADPIYNHLNQ